MAIKRLNRNVIDNLVKEEFVKSLRKKSYDKIFEYEFMRYVNSDRKNFRRPVNEELLTLGLLALAGIAFNVGSKVYDHFANKDKKENPSDPKWLVNTAQGLQSMIPSINGVSQETIQILQQDVQKILDALNNAGIKKYDPNSWNFSWGDLDPTGGLITTGVDLVKGKINGAF